MPPRGRRKINSLKTRGVTSKVPKMGMEKIADDGTQSDFQRAEADRKRNETFIFAHASEEQSTFQCVSENNYKEQIPIGFENQDNINTDLGSAQKKIINKGMKNRSNSKMWLRSSPQIIETFKKPHTCSNATDTRQYPNNDNICEQLNSDYSEISESLSLSEPVVHQNNLTPDEMHSNNTLKARFRLLKPLNKKPDKSGKQNERFDNKLLMELERKENKFYESLSENISINFDHFIDGTAADLFLKRNDFSDLRYQPENFKEVGGLSWSTYNFPKGYDVDLALKNRGHAIKTRGGRIKNQFLQIFSNRKDLYTTYLNSVQHPMHAIVKVPDENPSKIGKGVAKFIGDPISGFHKLKINIEARKKLIGRDKVIVICVCDVCREVLESHEAFREHCAISHPNVVCSCIEFEGSKKLPPFSPEELNKREISSLGILFNCHVPPRLSDPRCTKCKSDFKTSSELHSHMIECGNLKSSPQCMSQFNFEKRFEKARKSEMSFSQQDAFKISHNDLTTKTYPLSSKDVVPTSATTTDNFVEMPILDDQLKLSNEYFSADDMNIDKLNTCTNFSVPKHSLHRKTSKSSENIKLDSVMPQKTADLTNTSEFVTSNKKSHKNRYSSDSSLSSKNFINSTKQNMYSQEQETSISNDMDVSWLKDATFEISLSKQILKFSAKISESLSVETEQFLNLSNNTSGTQASSHSMHLPQNQSSLYDTDTRLDSTNSELRKETLNSNISQTAVTSSGSLNSVLKENTRRGEKEHLPVSASSIKNREVIFVTNKKKSEVLSSKVTATREYGRRSDEAKVSKLSQAIKRSRGRPPE